MTTHLLHSQYLNETRRLHLVDSERFERHGRRIVLYCADGQMLTSLLVEMPSQVMESCLFVGIESNPETRAYDYIRGYAPDRFDAHERFVQNEVVSWVDREFGLDSRCCARGVLGCSNGASFAHAITARNPRTFSFAIVFSAADNRVRSDEYSDEHSSRYYLAAGLREPDYLQTTRRIASDLESIRANFVLSERDAGHNLGFWASELPIAMEWILSEMRPL